MFYKLEPQKILDTSCFTVSISVPIYCSSCIYFNITLYNIVDNPIVHHYETSGKFKTTVPSHG